MKSHSLARELIDLGEALLKGPNVETKSQAFRAGLLGTTGANPEAEMAFGVTTLAQLSRFKRTEWINFARQHNLAIEFNERDSSRNIMGKIMSYLADRQPELERVRDSVARSTGSSNRLNQAFNTLL